VGCGVSASVVDDAGVDDVVVARSVVGVSPSTTTPAHAVRTSAPAASPEASFRFMCPIERTRTIRRSKSVGLWIVLSVFQAVRSRNSVWVERPRKRSSSQRVPLATPRPSLAYHDSALRATHSPDGYLLTLTVRSGFMKRKFGSSLLTLSDRRCVDSERDERDHPEHLERDPGNVHID